ncbi:MAG: phosphoribosylformylglycinamidine synthase subunit PurS [bacterium]|nr:phosphoribosylformylglycinamidine synthase subunit PurS [bacterium]
MKVVVGIRTQDSIPNPVGESLAERLRESGYTEVKQARVGQLIELELDGADETSIKTRIERISKSLIMHPNTETFEILAVIDDE